MALPDLMAQMMAQPESAVRRDSRRDHRDVFRCSVCGTEISREAARIDQTCSHWKCRREHHRRLQARVRESRDRETVRRRRFRAKVRWYRRQCASQIGVDAAKTYSPIYVPRQMSPLVSLSEERKEVLRGNLRRLIDEATRFRPDVERGTVPDGQVQQAECDDSFAPVASPLPVLPVLLGSACATCGGYCCGDGGEIGHLKPEDIRKQLNSRPDESPDDLIEDYLSHTATMTVEGSCIFHGGDGCTLPRSMRSQVCNAFECNGLKELHRQAGERGRKRFFVVTSQDEQLGRFRFLNATSSDKQDSATNP